MPQTKVPSWAKSKAKKLLEYDIRNRKDLKRDGSPMGPKLVYKMHRIYEQYKYENFVTNLRSARKRVALKRASAVEDDAAVDRQIKAFPEKQFHTKGVGDERVTYPRWGGHAAQYLLRYDIFMGLHKTKTPKKLQKSRPLYHLFPPRVFRDHIYKELKAIKQRNW
eukprot:CAMPEP_0198146002 /NCGR_PEP_ID=MMETSP1443-20131203/26838_1 /TAXON_ID=186043 /ORGANISM="Entomoneis sp., Strain CCMP2396" /LENGTH=164 /DNA_ID=CAMNT_0043809801 /DNA_START=184 /DNA_END=675 /DNA_ORIENTATION=-